MRETSDTQIIVLLWLIVVMKIFYQAFRIKSLGDDKNHIMFFFDRFISLEAVVFGIGYKYLHKINFKVP